MKRNYTASKGEGAGENKKYFSQQERDKASSHKIGARASLAEKPPITEAEVKSKPCIVVAQVSGRIKNGSVPAQQPPQRRET